MWEKIPGSLHMHKFNFTFRRSLGMRLGFLFLAAFIWNGKPWGLSLYALEIAAKQIRNGKPRFEPMLTPWHRAIGIRCSRLVGSALLSAIIDLFLSMQSYVHCAQLHSNVTCMGTIIIIASITFPKPSLWFLIVRKKGEERPGLFYHADDSMSDQLEVSL